jgi:hypothetical protein
MPFETNNRAVVHVVDDDTSLRGALESLFDSVGLITHALRAASDFSTPASRITLDWEPILLKSLCNYQLNCRLIAQVR